MSAVVVPMVAFTCDGEGCEERIPHPDSEYVAWSDIEGAEADAFEQDWLTLPDGRHYCASCRYARECDACEEHSDALTFSPPHDAHFCPPCLARETAPGGAA